MTRSPNRIFYRLAVIGAVSASLIVSACGRKGPLDAPPGTAVDQAAVVVEPEESGEVIRRGSARGLPVIKGPNKRIPLDVLLD